MKIEEAYKKFNQVFKIKRTGLVNRGVVDAESISEHIFSCVLMAFALLPDSLDSSLKTGIYEEYNKDLIIKLLLIHDLGEIDIGDIVRGTKTAEDKRLEYQSVHAFLSAIKQSNVNSNVYDCLDVLWADMESGHPQNINAIIAKEIDYIQGTYQYFNYCISNEVKYSKETCLEWLEEVSDIRIKTSIGRTIRDSLIINNDEFIGQDQLGRILKELLQV